MNTNALDAAWDAALDAPPDDQGPWRVLADMLLAEGSPQGELIQLELDLERGPLRGLARVRYQQLSEELARWCLPAGLDPGPAVFHRGVFVAWVGSVDQVRCDPEDPRWTTVKKLVLHEGDAGAGPLRLPRSPLTGHRLRRLEELGALTLESLELLADSPPKPRLRALRLFSPGSRPGARWAKAWQRLRVTHPTLRTLDFRGTSLAAEGALSRLFDQWLAPLEGLTFDRVTVEVALEHLARLYAWRQGHAPAFPLLANVGFGRLLVEVRPEELVLHAPNDEVLAEERLRRGKRLAGDVVSMPDTETLLRMNWGPLGSQAPPIRWPT